MKAPVRIKTMPPAIDFRGGETWRQPESRFAGVANGAGTPAKGGPLLMESRGARTDAEGRFFLDGERAITIIKRGSWRSATLKFTHAGFHEYQTNYIAAGSAEEPPGGAPLVNAGEIILQPKRK
jgi:hypothetical protein